MDTSQPALSASGRPQTTGDGSAVLVLGMHRSGTSSVAGSLVRLGGAAPLHLMPPGPDNERGYWESNLITPLNEELLAAGQSDWTDWRRFNPTLVDPQILETLRKRAKAAFLVEFGAEPLPVVKDPRICRLLGFWSSLIEELGWSIRAILTVRAPLEVALSLYKRDRIPLSQGCLIWLRYVLDAELETRDKPRAFVGWNEFLIDRRGTLERVGKQLELDWPRWSEAALAEVDEFVTPDQRHQSVSDTDLQVHSAVSAVVREAYAALVDLVDDPASREVQTRLDEVRGRFEEAAAIFDESLFDVNEEGRRWKWRTLEERQEFARRLQAVQVDLLRVLASRDGLQGELSLAREEAASFSAVRDELAAEIKARHDLEIRLGKANERLERLKQSLAYMADRYSRLHRAAGYRLRGQNGPKNLSEQLQAIRQSIFFDEDYYLNSSADVRSLGTDPSLHYLLYGAKEGRNPGPLFSTRRYLERFPDVAATGVNPLAHYELSGRAEGRGLFDPEIQKPTEDGRTAQL